MSALSSQLVLLGLVASLTPLGVGAVVIVANGRRTRNGCALALGWASVLGAIAVCSATVLHGRVRPEREPSQGVAVLMVALGVVCWLGAFLWAARARSRTDVATKTKQGRSLRERLVGLGPGRSFLAGIALAPYPLGIAAGSELIQTDADAGARWLALIAFCALSVWSMLATVFVLARWPEQTQARIEAVQQWISARATAIIVWALALFGLWCVWRGVAVLQRH